MMSNSLTIRSRIGKVAGSGLQTIVGMPASLAYSNFSRIGASSLPGAMLPQLRGVIPASLNFLATAWRSSFVLLSGRWASLIEQ